MQVDRPYLRNRRRWTARTLSVICRNTIVGLSRKSVSAVLLFVALTIVSAGHALADVYHSKESALRLAFPDADSVDKREIFLNSEQKTEVESLARVKLASRLATMYVGRKNGYILGYAFIETHQVRSLPETILIVIAPDGRTRGIHMLAFHEPPEYAPPKRWLTQFQGRPLTDELSLRGDLAGIAGSTLTANAITAAVRRALAIFEVSVGSPESKTSSDKGPIKR
jgi:hypothetical protein